MHFHLPFTALQVIWTLIFAGQLVLLVVLLGRNRTARFGWFTVGVAVNAVRLIVAELLFQRLPMIPYNAISLALACLSVVVSLLVLIEIARPIFEGVSIKALWIGALWVTAVGAATITLWGPWPAREILNLHTQIGVLRVLQLSAVKGELLAAIMAVALGGLVLVWGRNAKFGWRGHPKRILLGITTYSIALIATQVIRQLIVRGANSHPLSHADYEHVLDLMDRISNVPYTALVPVQMWWIYTLWTDEPGRGESATDELGPPELVPHQYDPPDQPSVEEAGPDAKASPAKTSQTISWPANEPANEAFTEEKASPSGNQTPEQIE